MSVSPGTSFGNFEITLKLGAGGMGEVYRARDSKLKREVALKVLPADVASDRERLARFQREAEVLAALNHPNIAHIHGLEEANGTTALVMELVEGEDLAQRIARGPIPFDEVLPIARQIADALEAAHEQGIIHRDLKPANIKVRDDGTVKVLDFGLAKALDQGLNASTPHGLENSPTITTPAMTMRGVILGTAAYMSPEQAKGKPVDRRADIWAFGCVLFEMLTGKKAFAGDDVTDTITSVMRDAPDWQALPAATPPPVRTLLRRCLEKDARQRPPHIGIARLDIDDAMIKSGPITPIAAPTPQPARQPRWRWLAEVVLIVLALTGGWSYGRSSVPELPRAQAIRFQLEAPLEAPYSQQTTSFLALSPDGTQVVYIGRQQGRSSKLRLHSFVTGGSRDLANTDGVISVFWSPDGNSIAFRNGERLQRLDLQTGALHSICDCRGVGAGTWNADGTILVALQTIARVPAGGGGVPEAVTVLDEANGELRHGHPYFLPDGRRFLYTSFNRDAEKTTLRVGELGSTVSRPLGNISSGAQYVAAGFLFYAHNSQLMARRFDATRAEWTGDPMVIAETVRQQGQGGAAFSVSLNGVVAYDPTLLWGQELELVWVGRDGKTQSVFAALDNGGHTVALSHDDKVAAVEQITTSSNAVWLIDGERGTRTRLTFEKEAQGHPVWSPDGRRVAYFAGQPGATTTLLVKDVAGTRAADALTAPSPGAAIAPKQPADWSRDGRFVVFEEQNPRTGWDLKYVETGGDHRIAIAVQTPFHERLGQLSPDGKLIAYESDETGQREIFVATFPDAASRWPISNRGGAKPRWNANGSELVFVDGQGVLQSVEISMAAGFRASRPTPLFELGAFETDGYHYAIARDGARFLVMRISAKTPQPKLTVIMNWRPTAG